MADTRLLLVDDEPALADLLKKYLARLGYEVDVCTTSEDALALFDADPDRYALVLTDLSLPRINGEEMLGRMRVRNPGLRALISSGYPYQPASQHTGFLQKPFLPKMLADEIEKMLKERKL
jgi:DNA-binding NtrC family response regulator